MKRYILFIALAAFSVASCVKDRVSSGGGTVVTPPVNTSGDSLLHYWNFNTDSATALIPTKTIGEGALNYAGAYYDTVQLGTFINAQGADTNALGGALRLRNPATGPLTMTMPTTGYKNIVLTYAEERTSKGAAQNVVSYTVDGTNYVNTALQSQVYSYGVDTVFTLVSFDFSSDPAVNDNPNFKVQINFASGSANTTGNDRMDNITLMGAKK